MDTHPIDPVALISGLFFGLAGLAILADQQWDEVDVTAFTAAGVMLIGLLLLGLVIANFIRGSADVEPANVEPGDLEPADPGPADRDTPL